MFNDISRMELAATKDDSRVMTYRLIPGDDVGEWRKMPIAAVMAHHGDEFFFIPPPGKYVDGMPPLSVSKARLLEAIDEVQRSWIDSIVKV